MSRLRLCLLLLAEVCVACGAPGEPPAGSELQTMRQGALGTLVLGYDFEDASGTTAEDGSGNGNTGTLLNGAAFVAGPTGNALSLAGAAHVYVDDNPSLRSPTTSVTLMAWVKLAVPEFGRQEVVRKGGSYDLWFYEGVLRMTTTAAEHVGTDCAGPRLTAASEWHHVAGVYDGARLATYLNGVLVCDRGGTGTLSYDTRPLCVGRDCQFDGSNLVGEVDQVRIYTGGSTAQEVCESAGGTWGAGECAFPDYNPPTPPGTPDPTPNPSTGSVSLAWTESADTGSGVAEYSLEQSTDSGVIWTLLAVVTGNGYSGSLLEGSYVFRARATDGVGNASAYSGTSATLVVDMSSRRPSIVSAPQGSAAECGVPWTYSDGGPSATGDPPLEWSLGPGAPEGLSIDPQTGALQWVPTRQDAGLHSVVLRVENPLGVSTQEVPVEVVCVRTSLTVGCSAAATGHPPFGLLVVLLSSALRLCGSRSIARRAGIR